MEKVKKMLPKFCGFLFFGMMGTFVSAQKISYQVNSQTGALQTLSIANDPQKMNWLVATDGSQYRWVKENYGCNSSKRKLERKSILGSPC